MKTHPYCLKIIKQYVHKIKQYGIKQYGIKHNVLYPLAAAYVPILLSEVEQEQRHSGNGVGGNRSEERDRKSELVLRPTYQIFEWDRNNSDRNFQNVVRYVHIPLVP